MATTQAVTSRIDVGTLATAEAILAKHGLTTQDYCRMAIARLTVVGGIPWATVDEQQAITTIKPNKPKRRKRPLEEVSNTNE